MWWFGLLRPLRGLKDLRAGLFWSPAPKLPTPPPPLSAVRPRRLAQLTYLLERTQAVLYAADTDESPTPDTF